jgi:hypothetical protein
MDNWGKLGSSLIFYFVAIDDRRSTIRDKCKPKPILVWGTGAPSSNKQALYFRHVARATVTLSKPSSKYSTE